MLGLGRYKHRLKLLKAGASDKLRGDRGQVLECLVLRGKS